ncbi:LysM peptidoglycan-binding domain-containing protein [Sutterella sp.]|uniref:LysM peptidoglycan-binding domain-containing protein n=1 Tax=Sutterella sp. TaxID=1981025 RepID=UPI0026E02FB4|nr:LysM peptidoglycan-binding domain-containing protein [Sutterella sp.]MDO5532637.1 LysM peptidoglycan-binding domain-containing protein [Sutterella sp.]
MPFKRISLAAAISTLLCLPLGQAAHAAEGDEGGTPAVMESADAVEQVEVEATEAALEREQGIPSNVWARIRSGFAIPELNSKTVDRWTEYYAKDPQYVQRMALRASQYLYNIIEEVEARKLPTELALLPFVESAFQPEALSRAKASGLWQFMPATGANYDLEQNLWRDDRRDVLESTRAALDYFEYLHSLFHDWQLALAAYNWGEGSVQRAIRREAARKRPTDYSHLRMPRETANYVPKLEAIKRIVSDPAKYGIELPDVGNEPFFVRVTKPRDIDLKTAAELAGMSESDFRALNPSFKLPVIVASHNNVMLLPADRLDFFVDNLASWMDSGQPLSHWSTYKLQEGETLAAVAERAGMTESYLREVNGIPAGRKVLANSTLLVLADGEEQMDISAEEADAKLRLSPLTTWRRVTYRVRSGDTLSTIARRWHITQKSIVQANRLRSDRLRIGQRLVLTVPNVARSPIQTAAKRTSGASSSSGNHVIHAVRSGESLFSIARRYGVTVDELRMTNRLSGNTIRAGQRLRIPAAGVETSDTVIYTVRSGDTLSSIASRYGVSVQKLRRQNRLTSSALRVGDRLEIPEEDAPKAPPMPATSASPGTAEHVVRSGDTLSGIAGRYGTTVAKLRAANGLRGSNLSIGQRLVIPATAKRLAGNAAETGADASPGRTYRVRSGDTLSGIAAANGTTVSELRRVNGLSTNRLSVGQTLTLP